MELWALQKEIPTHNEVDSMNLFGEILIHKEGWRCYSSATCPDHDKLVGRFLGIHARTPGWISESVSAIQPMSIIGGKGNGYRMWGAVFLNGAVIQLSNDNETDTLLYVSEETARGWHYPDEDWVHTPSFFSATPTHERHSKP